MADQLLDWARDLFEGQIDFEGQRLAELITTFLLGASGILAFFIGFMSQDIKLTLYVGLAGSVLTFLAVVPPWPFYNKNPESWLPPLAVSSGYTPSHTLPSGISIDVDGQKVG